MADPKPPSPPESPEPTAERVHGGADWAKLVAMLTVAVCLPLAAWLLFIGRGVQPLPRGDAAEARTRRRVADLLKRGEADLRRDEAVRALRRFEAALQLDPRNFQAQNGRGLALFFAGRFPEAARAFAAAARIEPRSSNTQIWLYLARARAGEADAAAGLEGGYNRHRAHPETTPIVLLYLGEIPPEDCVAAMRTRSGALPPEREALAYFHIGQYYLLRGETAKARDAFARSAATGLSTLPAHAARRELKRLAGSDAGRAAARQELAARSRERAGKVFYDGVWMTPEELMARRGYVRRGEAWVPKAVAENLEAAERAAAAQGAPSPDTDEAMRARGYVRDGDVWVTPEQHAAMAAARTRAETGRRRQRRVPDPDEVMRRRGYVKYGQTWVTPAQYQAILARQRQMEEAWRRIAAAQQRTGARPAVAFPPEAAEWVLDDFQAEGVWRPTPWGNPCEVRTVQRGGRRVLEATLQGGTKLNTALQRTLAVDLGSRARLVLEVENPAGADVKVALALDSSEYFETSAQAAPQGKGRLAFSLDATDVKSRTTDWRYVGRFERLDRVERLYVLFYAEGPATLYLCRLTAERR